MNQRLFFLRVRSQVLPTDIYISLSFPIPSQSHRKDKQSFHFHFFFTLTVSSRNTSPVNLLLVLSTHTPAGFHLSVRLEGIDTNGFPDTYLDMLFHRSQISSEVPGRESGL